MTDTERQELYTLMQQWGGIARNDDILYQKVREWVEAKIAALQSERDALAQEYVAPDAELIAILSPLSMKNVPTSVIELTEKAMAKIAALQSERDALREALKSLEFSGDDGACPSCGHHPMNGHTAQCVFKAVLSIPTSGEPASKP